MCIGYGCVIVVGVVVIKNILVNSIVVGVFVWVICFCDFYNYIEINIIWKNE